MSNTATPLRFAALIRVSTEKQERRGDSLRTQDLQTRAAVEQLGGRITRHYAGQEHATAGWERQKLDQLLADAQQSPQPFNAVIVVHPDRWSRDNGQSLVGLQVLRDNGVRFFVLAQEQDLFDPTTCLHLAMAASIGSYQASLQAKKSLESRIERAKRGWPTCGKLPFGRTFDRASHNWVIDRTKQAMIQDVAARYIAGESMANLANEYGINHSFLHKTLTQRCGRVLVQHLSSSKLRIDETIPITIPALLEPETIAAVLRRAAANKTFCHGHLKHQYTFARVVFCGRCGYAMTGQAGRHGKRYYRHPLRGGACECPLPFRPWVSAELLEETVLSQLLDFWGNPKAIEEALAAAEPNRDEIAKLRKQLEQIENEIAKSKSGRERLMRYIIKGTISEEQADQQLTELNGRETSLSDDAERIRSQLAGTLSPEDRKRLAEQVTIARQLTGSRRRDLMRAAEDPERMTYEQKRVLVQDVFGGLTPDGCRMGVYVIPLELERNRKHRRWRYEIRGRIQAVGTLQDSDSAVTSYSRYSPGLTLPSPRSFSPQPQPAA